MSATLAPAAHVGAEALDVVPEQKPKFTRRPSERSEIRCFEEDNHGVSEHEADGSDAESERSADDSTGLPAFDNDEECVERERNASLQRTALAQKQVLAQLKCQERIKLTLADDDDFRPTLHKTEQNADGLYMMRRRSSVFRMSDAIDRAFVDIPLQRASFGALDVNSGDGTREKQTDCFVDRAVKSTARLARFAQQREKVLIEQEQKTERLAAHLKDEEFRVREKMRAQMGHMQRKAVAQAQRRAEKSKIAADRQREYDALAERQQELIYGKQGDAAKKTAGHSASSRAVPAVDSDPIVQDQMKSHDTYTAKLESWKQVVAENEKRSRTYWRKKLGPNHSAYKEALIPSPTSFRGKVFEVSKLAKAKARWTHSRGASASDNDSFSEAEGSLPGRSLSPSPDKNAHSFNTTRDFDEGMSELTKEQVRQQRRQLVEHVLAAQERQRQEAWSATERSVNDARKRKDAWDTGIKLTAKSNNDQIRRRTTEANRRKADQAVASDANLFRKQQEASRKREAEQRRLSHERSARALEKAETIRLSQVRMEEQLREQHAEIREEMARKDAQTMEYYTSMFKTHSDKIAAKEDDLTPEDRALKKRMVETEFQDKTRRELELKHTRSEGVLSRASTGAFDRSRNSRLERSLGSFSSGPLPSLCGSEPPLLESPTMTKISEVSSRPHHKRHSDDHDEKEEEFLQELQKRSCKWLQDMREEMAENPTTIR